MLLRGGGAAGLEPASVADSVAPAEPHRVIIMAENLTPDNMYHFRMNSTENLIYETKGDSIGR